MKKFIAIILALALVFSFAACANNTPAPAPADDTPEQESQPENDAAPEAEAADSDYIKGKGTLIVGITDFEPMDYQDENGEWIGFDADMAKAFADYLGVTAEFIEIDWDNKVLELNNKSIDCVWNGMTLTDGVLASMDCGLSYCNNGQVVVVGKGVADKYQDAEACNELVFAVESGSAGEEAAADLGFEYTAVLTQADALMEVAAGTSDACIIDFLMACAMTGEGTSYPDLTYTAVLTTEEYGVGFRQGSDLPGIYNDFYAQACGDGTVTEIAKTYSIDGSIILR